MATVTYTNRTPPKTKTVKNLGWLLRHAKEVKLIHVHAQPGRPEGCQMTVVIPGTIYNIAFASRTVCREWLRRPSLKGKPLCWFGDDTTC